jgi:4-amino-4-deoxy-L-arabinose transferase-like glycosyltransferase
MYAGYIFALHLSLLVSQSGLMMVIAQALLVIFSAYSLFSLTKEYGDDLAAWISTSFYLLFPMLTQWTRYILTESIFYSLIIIGLRLVTLKTRRVNFILLPFVTFLIVLRPNGFLVACALLTIFIINRTSEIPRRMIFIVSLWSFGVILYGVSLSGVSVGKSTIQNSVFEKTLEGNVVYGVKELFYKMPAPETEERSNLAFVKYVVDYPLDNIRIGLLRVYWELKQTRPWYSSYLNLFISVSMIFFYCLSSLSLFKIRDRKLVTYIGIVSAPSILLIALTWSIWEGRFGWWFLVSWIPLFGIGSARMVYALAGKFGGNSSI